MKKIIILSILLSIFTPFSAFAAGLDIITITTNPKTPGPNQDVTINMESYAVDLNTATIIWYVDKNPTKQGIGEKSLQIHTGELGTKMLIDIVILSPISGKIDKQITIAPAEVDLLWEAQTYTPPFYKGKALPSYKSLIKVTAIPRFNSFTSDPSQYTYNWKYQLTQGVGAGLGKNSVIIPAGWADSRVSIAVDVALPGTEWKGYKFTNIAGHEAKVVLYEQAPLLGVQFNRALSGITTGSGNTFDVRAVPYYFSTDNYQGGELVYSWSLNSQNVVPGLDPTNITITKQGEGEESYAVSLSVRNPKRILQEGSARASVTLPEEQ